MTSKKELLDAHRRYTEEVTPAVETLTAETIRTAGPVNAMAWIATVGISFLLCLGLLLLVAGG